MATVSVKGLILSHMLTDHVLFSVRFMLGGDHGKLKHGPPEGHSPVSESLMPKERLRIEPCFHLGNVPKGLVCGPAEVRGDTAFVPKPVDTSHVSIHRNKSIRIGLACPVW